MRYIVMLEMKEEDWEDFEWNAHSMITELIDWELIRVEEGDEEDEEEE